MPERMDDVGIKINYPIDWLVRALSSHGVLSKLADTVVPVWDVSVEFPLRFTRFFQQTTSAGGTVTHVVPAEVDVLPRLVLVLTAVNNGGGGAGGRSVRLEYQFNSLSTQSVPVVFRRWITGAPLTLIGGSISDTGSDSVGASPIAIRNPDNLRVDYESTLAGDVCTTTGVLWVGKTAESPLPAR